MTGNQNFKVLYNPHLKKDLKPLNKEQIFVFFQIIKSIILEDPYKGKKLKGKFSGLYKFRVGDYRIVYEINTAKQIIYILRFRLRKNVYDI